MFNFNKKEENKEKTGRSLLWLGIVLLIAAVLLVPRVFGQKFTVGFAPFNIETYEDDGRNGFSFKYNSELFEIDDDPNNRYGAEFKAGLKRIDNERTGCDVRRIQETLDLDRELEEVAAEMSENLASGNTSFQTTNSDFDTIDGRKALRIDATFLGPVGDLSQLSQYFIPEEDGEYTWTLICGGLKSMEPYYEEDYNRFFKSFKFKKT